MTFERTDAGFTALPAGWYSYYAKTDERGRRKVYRTPCPGILKVEILNVDDAGAKTHSHYSFQAAELADGLLAGANEDLNPDVTYLGTFYGEEYWEEFGELAPNETALTA